MYAIVSLFDRAGSAWIHTIWQELEEKCGLAGIRSYPLPHFSWQGAETYELEQVKSVLGRLIESLPPFTIKTVGIGIFTGKDPVIYLSLVKDSTLTSIHKEIWDKVKPLAKSLNIHYAPEFWVPHITLSLLDVTSANLGCALNYLSFRPLECSILVDRLALVYQEGDQVGDVKIGFDLKVPR